MTATLAFATFALAGVTSIPMHYSIGQSTGAGESQTLCAASVNDGLLGRMAFEDTVDFGPGPCPGASGMSGPNIYTSQGDVIADVDTVTTGTVVAYVGTAKVCYIVNNLCATVTSASGGNGDLCAVWNAFSNDVVKSCAPNDPFNLGKQGFEDVSPNKGQFCLYEATVHVDWDNDGNSDYDVPAVDLTRGGCPP